MAEALKRSLDILENEAGVDMVPPWIYELSFGSSNSKADPYVAGHWIENFRDAEKLLRSKVAHRVPRGANWRVETKCSDLPAIPPWAADRDDAQLRMIVALTRLAMGAALEAAIAGEALRVCAPGTRIEDNNGALARLYNDGFLIATWSSAHAHYVAAVQSGVEDPPAPDLNSVPNSANEWDFSDIFSRRSCPRQCPKLASQILQILTRSTNPGSRGWDTLLASSLADSQAARLIVSNSVIVTMGTLHPFLHPCLRPPWALRMKILRTVQMLLQDVHVNQALSACAASTKEAVRRMLASTVALSPATHAAMLRISHPVGYLTSPPMALPACGTEGAAVAFLQAGMDLANDTTGKLTYTQAVRASFSRHAVANSSDSGSLPVWVHWDGGWLGKGNASTHQKVSLVAVASDLWSLSFRSNFIVFWTHALTNSLRVSRLDQTTHKALHSLNATTRLTQTVPVNVQLESQRKALAHPSSGILTMHEAAQFLGIQNVKGSSSNGGGKGSQDALRSLSAAGAEATSRLLNFARAAWVSEEVLIVEFGAETKRMQLKALFSRFGKVYDETTSTEAEIPIHGTHLHACVECRRIATAFAKDSHKMPVPFDEMGVSSSMLCVECAVGREGCTHIRCAKRGSAALRTALVAQEIMTTSKVESMPANPVLISDIITGERNTQNDASDSGGNAIAARIRRDAKSTLEQRSTALSCGDEPMLSMSLVGRAVRLWNEWYCLCSFCGCALRLMPHHRFGAEICCLKCDALLLGHTPVVQAVQTSAVCRYCWKVDESGARWKAIKAPFDTSGANKDLPPPLRTVRYCTQHFKPWLTTAHRVLTTRAILSHIALGAKPVFSDNAAARRQSADDLGFEEAEEKTKKRKKA